MVSTMIEHNYIILFILNQCLSALPFIYAHKAESVPVSDQDQQRLRDLSRERSILV